jgi:hypothetical protein
MTTDTDGRRSRSSSDAVVRILLKEIVRTTNIRLIIGASRCMRFLPLVGV